MSPSNIAVVCPRAITLGSEAINEVKPECDPAKLPGSLDPKRCQSELKKQHKVQTPKKTPIIPAVSYIEGERDRSTVSDCDQKFIEAKISEEDWKLQCFSPGTWNFDRREQLLQELEDRKKFEGELTFWNQVQFRAGFDLVKRHTFYQGVYADWNQRAKASSGPSFFISVPSDDGEIDKGSRYGLHLSLDSGPGLTRVGQNTLLRMTIIDGIIHDSTDVTGIFPMEDDQSLNVLDFSVYSPFLKYNFLELGANFWKTDPMLWLHRSSLHAGMAMQLLGTPIKTSDPEKTVFGIQDFLRNYFMLGVSLYLMTYTNDTVAAPLDYFCQKATKECKSNDALKFYSRKEHPWIPHLKSHFDEFIGYASAHVEGEHLSPRWGFGYRFYFDMYPSWATYEAGGRFSLQYNKGKLRLMLQGAGRKFETYGNETVGVASSASELSLGLSLGYRFGDLFNR